MDTLGLTEHLSSYIIRPPKASYSLPDLGQKIFQYKSILYQRIDYITPPTQSTPSLHLSLYVDHFYKESSPRPTVLYLHANSSSRLAIKNYLVNLIGYFDVLAMDFRGCGMSQGKYCTLGALEVEDVKTVIQFVDGRDKLERGIGKRGAKDRRKYMIWGRSMGAVSAIGYMAKYGIYDDRVTSLVLDSPFSDLQKLMHELANKKFPLIPKFMLQSALQSLQAHIKKVIQAQYKQTFLIRTHKPINKIGVISHPIFFIGSKNDELVDNSHLKALYEAAKGSCRREMEMLEGGHNQMRPEHLKIAVVQFLLAGVGMKIQKVQYKPEKEKDRVERDIRRKIFGIGAVKGGMIFAKEDQQKQRYYYEQQTMDKKNKSHIQLEQNERKKSSSPKKSARKQRKIYQKKQYPQLQSKQNEPAQQYRNSIPNNASQIPQQTRQRSKSSKNRLFHQKSNPNLNPSNQSLNTSTQQPYQYPSNNAKIQSPLQVQLSNPSPNPQVPDNASSNPSPFESQPISNQNIKNTHNEILDKVLPPTSVRRNNRIFAYGNQGNATNTGTNKNSNTNILF